MCDVQVLWSPCPSCSLPQWTECIKVQQPVTTCLMSYCDYCVCQCLSVLCISPLCNRPAVNQELSNIFNELWRLDVNRMTPGIDYTISVQVWNMVFFGQGLSSVYTNVLYVLCPGQSQLCKPGQQCGAGLRHAASVLQRQWEQTAEHDHLLPWVPLLFLSLKVQLICRLHCNKYDLCACRAHKTPGQLWAGHRRDRASHNRGADRD